mgnify:CR=1 FL=1
MKKFLIYLFTFITIFLVSIIIIPLLKSSNNQNQKQELYFTYNNISMKIQSPEFENGVDIPPRFTCDGENINPSLNFLDIPENTKSFTLIVEDHDVPKNIRADGLWDHWIIWNIPKEVTSLPENYKEQGMMGKNSGGEYGYSGPCPPDSEHRYYFKLYALDTMLELNQYATKEELLNAMHGHILDQAELIGKYKRQF